MAAFPQEQQPAPVELPTIDVKPEDLAPPPPGPPHVDVAGGATRAGTPEGDPWADFPRTPPTKPEKGVPHITVRPNDAAPSPELPPPRPDDPWAGFPREQPPKPPAKPKGPEVSTGQAALTGVAHGLSFGTAPALAGLSEVADEPIKQLEQNLDIKPGSTKVAPHVRAALGAAEMLTNWMTGQKDPGVQEAYERGRKIAREREESADEQHKWAYLAGVMSGTMATPGMGPLRAAPAGGRFVQGAIQGGVGGAGMGAGEAIGEGKSGKEIVKSGVIGTAVGAPVGGAFGAVLGPRATTGVGQRAAHTASELLDEPLPRVAASENPTIQSTGAKLRQMPFAGEEIGAKLERVGTAAGRHVRDVAEGMAGGRPERSVAQAAVRPGFEHVIANNERRIDAAYDALRSQINLNQRFTMPNTDRAVNEVMQRRAAAGWENPAEGLAQFRNVAGGAPYEGAHRARADARKAGAPGKANPGYDAGDFNYIVRAMTGDIRNIVSHAATNNTPAGRSAALRAFDDAERQFGPLSEQNKFIERLMDLGGEGGIAKLLQAATEKKGNLALLAQVRAGMQPDEFQQIGAMLLHEIGSMPSVASGFSLSKFSTEWRNISDGAKRVLFAPEHVRNLNDIAEMGHHIKHAMRETSTSHSASALVLLEIAQAAALLGAGAATGEMTIAGAATAGVGAASWLMARWLATPAPAASMGAWTRAYRAMTFGTPTPARVASFNIATRNLANTLGVPVEKVADIVAAKAGLKAEPGQDQEVKQK